MNPLGLNNVNPQLYLDSLIHELRLLPIFNTLCKSTITLKAFLISFWSMRRSSLLSFGRTHRNHFLHHQPNLPSHLFPLCQSHIVESANLQSPLKILSLLYYPVRPNSPPQSVIALLPQRFQYGTFKPSLIPALHNTLFYKSIT